ncbi:MAG: hypothetical protein P1U38_09750 [Aeromicrobium sp.]|uniref:hypothetical protein n=1 Tax=Aeromicrobium sp. TaxID=1871063 RepID=UPI00262E0FAF|nr:hypothetical protein [Aeromicrobium sp.]MDF1705045.1 hypothetical protein [Aeromicrobium sp.]
MSLQENDPQQEDRITPEITAYIRNLSPQQQVDVAAVLGHLAPAADATCPSWCERRDETEYPCRGDHFANVGNPVNGSRANDLYRDGQGDPIELPMIFTNISWPVIARSGLTISLYDRASEVQFEFEPDRFVDLMTNMALAVRTLMEDGQGLFPGWEFEHLVEHIDAIRPAKVEDAA